MSAAEGRLDLAVELSSITRGRHFARDMVVGWGLDELADDVQLGTSELVTNAIQHAGTEVRLTIRRDTTVTVLVEDFLPELHQPAAPQVDAVAEHGRGLQIVAAISSDWGIRIAPEGKCVWFSLQLPDSNGADADVYAIDRKKNRASQVSDERDESDELDESSEDERDEALGGG